MQPRPDFILCGAQKAGTTSLARYLDAHPGCRMSQPKEPNVFAAPSPPDPDAYAACFPDVGEGVLTGEATTAYLHAEGAAAAIADALRTDLRLVFALRNPVDRAVSGFLHLHKRGHDRRSIEDLFAAPGVNLRKALAAERDGIREAQRDGRIDAGPYHEAFGDGDWPFRYLANSDYATQLAPYVRRFGRQRMHIVHSEDLRAAPARVYRDVLDFLGLDPVVPDVVGQEFNVTRVPRLLRVGKRQLRVPPALAWLARPLMPRLLSQPPDPIAPNIRDALDTLFAPSVRRLERMGFGPVPGAWPR